MSNERGAGTMSVTLYISTIVLSLFFVLSVVELVRRGKLREQYSLLWLGFGLILLILSASKRLLGILAKWFGVYYAPSLLFLFGLLFAFALILHITVVISRQTDRVIRLTQELAITQHRLAELEEELSRQKQGAQPRYEANDTTLIHQLHGER
jgi:hypothetical protein